MLIKTYDYNLSFIICNKHTWLELKLGLQKILDYQGCGYMAMANNLIYPLIMMKRLNINAT